MPTIQGPFTVELEPLEAYANSADDNRLGRMSINKTFTGPMAGTSVGEMLTAMTTTEGAAGYVAIEQFTGEIDGKRGSCIFQHFGVMAYGDERLVLQVVPESGSGELKGLSGTVQILRDDGHQYVFDYQLDPS